MTTNFITQWMVFIFFDAWWVLYLALITGTLVGLVTKYILDKQYIFHYKALNSKDDLAKFGLYSLIGLGTTLIFWSMEVAFYYAFEFKNAKYLGGIIGLTIGYLIKYHLDKRHVFKVTS